jgi:hypothetical protein
MGGLIEPEDACRAQPLIGKIATQLRTSHAVGGMSTSIKMDLGEVVIVDIPGVVLW